ncbi:MAG: hypothetical protein NTW23_01315 [Rhodoluna sp.]|nr:hypothetical protein [Rhodoluna sp.]
MSAIECYSFHPGHNLHHSKIDDFNKPRMPITISHVMNNAFLVSFKEESEYWYHHMPHRLLEALFNSHPEGIEATEDKRFIFIYTGGLILRFNMAQETISNCIQVTKNPEVHPVVAQTIKKLNAENIKKLIERGISG